MSFTHAHCNERDFRDNRSHFRSYEMILRYSLALTTLFCSASALACQTPDNLVPNCGFLTNANGWEIETGTCARDANSGASGTGNLTCSSFAGMFSHIVRFRRCLLAANGVSGGKVYSYSAFSQRVSGSNVICNLELADFTSDNCANNVNAATTPLVFGTPPSYLASVPATYTVAANTVSASIRVDCTSQAAFQIRVDDVHVGVQDPIFKSGFET